MTTTSSVPSEEEILNRWLEFRLAELHTSMPGKVTAFYPDTCQCDVQPLIRQVFEAADGTRTVQAAPPLSSVPISYPRGGGFRFTWPLKVGDTVLLVFAERSLDDWAQAGGEVSPRAARMHHWDDAIAIPGISPAIGAPPGVGLTDMVLGAEDGSVEMRLAGDGTVTITAPQVALGGAGGASVARVGDEIQIDAASAAAFFAWMSAAAASGPSPFAPFTSPILGRIISGSPGVTAK